MKPQKDGYRVAVVGASSLLGKELITVLEEKHFLVSRLLTFEADEEEADLPIVDLREGSRPALQDQDVTEGELDFAFLAAAPRSATGQPSFLTSLQNDRSVADQPAHRCRVIDLTGKGQAVPGGQNIVRVPFLDRRFPSNDTARDSSALYVSAHPGVIVISSLLLRLAARFPLVSIVAQVFGSASEGGTRGVEELQKQTVNLLSFQKIPRQVFGAQLAFNTLPRPGRAGCGEMLDLETRLRQQLRQYLNNRVPLPALRLVHVPVFCALGVSLYVETSEPVAPEAACAALAGERVRLRRPSQEAPSQVEVTGSSDILVDSVSADPDHPTSLWLWAVADNIRLAAVNAVEVAESLGNQPRL
jgi:aspartate-semialdehyde dehydrogenase